MRYASGDEDRVHLAEPQQCVPFQQELFGGNRGTRSPCVLHMVEHVASELDRAIRRPTSVRACSAKECPCHKSTGNRKSRNHKPDICAAGNALTSRVKSHEVKYDRNSDDCDAS